MLSIHIENIGDIAMIECEGRIVRSEAAFELRREVKSQRHAQMIVLNLSEVAALDGGGLGMLMFLQRWAHDHGIQFKLFNPRHSVQDRLEQVSLTQEFDIITLDEIMALLAHTNDRHARAA